MSATTIAACASASAIPATRTWCCTGCCATSSPTSATPRDGWLPKVLGALAEESALLAEGTGKADERYMSRVAHLAPPPSPPKEPPDEESKA